MMEPYRDSEYDNQVIRKWAVEWAQRQGTRFVTGHLVDRTLESITKSIDLAVVDVNKERGEWIEPQMLALSPDEVLAFAQKLEHYVLTGEIE